MKNFKHYLPVIFTGATLVGVVGSNVITAIQAPKAYQKVKDADENMMYDKGRALTKWERIKIASPYYIPSFLTIMLNCLLKLKKFVCPDIMDREGEQK